MGKVVSLFVPSGSFGISGLSGTADSSYSSNDGKVTQSDLIASWGRMAKRAGGSSTAVWLSTAEDILYDGTLGESCLSGAEF